MRGLVLALLLPVVASAQPIVGPEIRSASFESLGPIVDGPSPALGIVRISSGFAMTWAAVTASGHSRVLFATLNAEATTTSTVQLLTLDDAADAYHPAIAWDGTGYLVAWTEISGLEPKGAVAIARLDPSGHLIGSPRLLEMGLIAPIVYSGGAGYYIGVGGTLWTVSADGSNLRSSMVEGTIDTLTGTSSQVAFGEHWTLGPACFFHCPPAPPSIYRARIELIGSCSAVWDFESSSLPLGIALASDGQQYLVLWPDGDSTLRAFRMDGHCNHIDALDAIRIDHLFAGGPAKSNPQVAWDGSRFLVVYRTSETEIRAATIQDGRASSPFVIASGDARRATVINAGPDRFLVAYEVRSSSGTQLAGRFIDFPPPRRRVAK